jgi:2-iminoacetate synthase
MILLMKLEIYLIILLKWKRYGIGPHNIYVPRIKKAVGAKLSYELPYVVDADYFAYIAALLRIAIPYTGIILSTRESKTLEID